MHMSVVSAYWYVSHIHAILVLTEDRKEHQIPQKWRYSYKVQYGFWEANLGPWQELQVLFTAEHLYIPSFYCSYNAAP